MIKPHERLGLLLGFFGMCLFAGTLPATWPAVFGLMARLGDVPLGRVRPRLNAREVSSIGSRWLINWRLE
jgi:hypothetical protein